jgi:carboxypeptidase C (cathepsin A)
MSEDIAVDLRETVATRRGSVSIAGVQVEYTARAENIVLRDDDGAPSCSIFVTSYTRENVEDASRGAARPVLYAFDGGPGTASVTLHLGLLGPRRADIGEGSIAASVPPRVVDNPRSLLDVCDLVIIDPVGTGFSRPAPGGDPRRFFGYTADMQATAQVVVEHLSRSGRWSSPVLLLGESYGGVRACGMAAHLQERYGLHLSGVVLLVPVLSSQALSFTPGNDLPYIVYLPTLAAVAHHHRRAGVDVDLAALLAEAERFAVEEYAPALLRGRTLDASERAHIAARIASLIGLSPGFVERCNLRVGDLRFFKELLRDRRQLTSRADPRFVGVDRDAAGDEPQIDPYTAFFRRAYVPAANAYLRDELGYRTPHDYRAYDSRVLPWKYADVAENAFLFPAEYLRLAMARHPAMQVFVGTGTFDGSVPYFAVQNTIDRTFHEPAQAESITVRRYDAGHILYDDPVSAAALRDDLLQFVGRATRGAGDGGGPQR